MTDPLLTAREGAALFQLSVPTFWRWVSQGTLPKAVKLGGMSRWPQSELIAVIERAKAKRTPAGGKPPPSARAAASIFGSQNTCEDGTSSPPLLMEEVEED
jgi:predicted DNA-binding transcriptional regulator AlpA